MCCRRRRRRLPNFIISRTKRAAISRSFGIRSTYMCAVNASGNLQKCDLFYENKYWQTSVNIFLWRRHRRSAAAYRLDSAFTAISLDVIDRHPVSIAYVPHLKSCHSMRFSLFAFNFHPAYGFRCSDVWSVRSQHERHVANTEMRLDAAPLSTSHSEPSVLHETGVVCPTNRNIDKQKE